MADLREDPWAFPALEALAACLCTELVAAGIPATCFCGIVPGDQAILDIGSCDETGCGGSAWVRLVSVYPSLDMVTLDNIGVCTTQLAFELEVGVVRCSQVMHEDGTAPTVEESFRDTQLQLADMAAMHRAIRCCFANNETYDHRVGVYSPMSTSGGVLGGTWQVYAQRSI